MLCALSFEKGERMTKYIKADDGAGKMTQLEVSVKGNFVLPGRYLVKTPASVEWQWASLARTKEGWQYEMLPAEAAPRRDRAGEAAAAVLAASLLLLAVVSGYAFIYAYIFGK